MLNFLINIADKNTFLSAHIFFEFSFTPTSGYIEHEKQEV